MSRWSRVGARRPSVRLSRRLRRACTPTRTDDPPIDRPFRSPGRAALRSPARRWMPPSPGRGRAVGRFDDAADASIDGSDRTPQTDDRTIEQSDPSDDHRSRIRVFSVSFLKFANGTQSTRVPVYTEYPCTRVRKNFSRVRPVGPVGPQSVTDDDDDDRATTTTIERRQSDDDRA